MTYKNTLPILLREFKNYFRTIISFIVLYLLYLSAAFAQFPAGWQHKQAVVIQNPGGAKTNYPVSLTIDTKELIAAAKMRSDGGDIRFAENCNGSTRLSYYVDTGINTTKTLIWVKIPALPAGSKTIYLFYGKSDSTSLSNLNATFTNQKVVTSSEVILKGTKLWNHDLIDIRSTGTVTLAPDYDTIFTLNARKILINGILNGDGTGYSGVSGDKGPGAGKKGDNSTGGGGGGYGNNGGKGGASSNLPAPGAGGPANGTMCGYDINRGSAGGEGNPTSVSGNGGGAFVIKGGSISITGTVSVNGTNAPDAFTAGGGGAGGGILIHGKGVRITGTLSAKGGKGGNRTVSGNGGGGGGGSGGRIKVFYLDACTNPGPSLLNGGGGGTSSPSGIAGGSGTYCPPVGNYPTAEPVTQLQSLAPTVDIAATDEDICVGESVTFTATVTNGGAATYSWKLNSDANTVSTNPTYTSSGLSNNDKVYCIIGASGCVSPSSARSDTITMKVSSSIIPTCEITVDKQMPVCPGTEVTFTATNINGGNPPTYEWKVNGIANSATGSTYTTSTLTNNDVVSCKMTVGPDMTCANPSTVESNQIVMKVEYREPTVVITVQNDSICPDSTARFTSQVTFGGNTPQYQWQVDQQNVTGETGPSFNTDTLDNGDKVRCRLISNDPCAEPDTVFSNEIAMYVGDIKPKVYIKVDNMTVCAGANGTGTVTFRAYPDNGGSSCQPTYFWKKVGSAQNAMDDEEHVQDNISDGQCFYCVMTSCLDCAAPASVNSDTICITVVSSLIPQVTITVSPNDTICAGDVVTFTAHSTTGGVNPTYEWKKKNTNETLGSGSSNTLILSNVQDQDVIYCIMRADPNIATCTDPDSAKSNEIKIRFATAPVVSVTIDGDTTICKDEQPVFTATHVNGGVEPTYEWFVNSLPIDTNTTGKFSYPFANNDTVWCKISSDLSCASKAPVPSNRMVVRVSEVGNVDFKHEHEAGKDSVGHEFTFIITEGKGPNRTYHWDFNDPDSPNDEAFGDSAKHTFAKGYGHDVTLTVTTTDSVCTNKKVNTVLIKTGITQYNYEGLKLSPNPNTGDFMLELDDQIPVSEIQVLDIRGQLIYKQTSVKGNKHRVVLPDPVKGLYIVKIITKNKIITTKILIH